MTARGRAGRARQAGGGRRPWAAVSPENVIRSIPAWRGVTTDEARREVWVYDKISTTSVYSRSSGGVSALIFGVGNGLVGGVGSANYKAADGATSTTQKTLTVIIKFNEHGTVRDFAYHTSRF